MMNLPKRIVLPFGYIITVKLATRAWMNEQMDGEPEDGYWDRDIRTIFIASDDLSVAHQRYILAHELQHAVADFMDEYLDTWSISERSSSTNGSAKLISAGGRVAAGLAMDSSVVHPNRPESTGQ